MAVNFEILDGVIDALGQAGFVETDGGRAAAGYKGQAGDCAVRALAIVTGKPYAEIYDLVAKHCKNEKPSKTRRGKSSARNGVHRVTFDKVAAELGLVWHSTMKVGQGVRVHVRADELPRGRMVLNLSRHYAAYIDGAVHDNHDPRRGGKRAVYGYWIMPE